MGRKQQTDQAQEHEQSSMFTILPGHREARRLRNHWEKEQTLETGIQIECGSWNRKITVEKLTELSKVGV